MFLKISNVQKHLENVKQAFLLPLIAASHNKLTCHGPLYYEFLYTCEMMFFKFIEDSKMRSNVTFKNFSFKEQVEGFNKYKIKPVRKLNKGDFHPFKLSLESHSAFADMLWFLFNIHKFMKPHYKSIIQKVLTEKANDLEKTIFVKLILSRLICYFKYDRENKCFDISLKET